jgi:hypothetical protein
MTSPRKLSGCALAAHEKKQARLVLAYDQCLKCAHCGGPRGIGLEGVTCLGGCEKLLPFKALEKQMGYQFFLDRPAGMIRSRLIQDFPHLDLKRRSEPDRVAPASDEEVELFLEKYS